MSESLGQSGDSTAAATPALTQKSRPEHPGIFATTHWSVVLSAQDKQSPDSTLALETLCRAYWYPLYAYVRRVGHSPPDAEDLTQGFFARLLEKNYLSSASREKGKFRTFLLVVLKRYLANEWDRQHARKRGGFASIIPIEVEFGESRLAAEPADNSPPDLLFDRQWAALLLDRTISRLRTEYTGSGRAVLFEQLQGFLGGNESRVPYQEIATRLNLTEAAVKMAVYRLRARYRELVRLEIAETVDSPAAVEEEIRHLFAAFG